MIHLETKKQRAVALKREAERCYEEKARPGAASPIQAPVSFGCYAEKAYFHLLVSSYSIWWSMKNGI